MRSEAPPLLPIFRSRHQAELLALLYLQPEREFSLTELAGRLWRQGSSSIAEWAERICFAPRRTADMPSRSPNC